MRASVIEEFGDPDVFERAEVARPEVGPDRTLVRVEATSVNPVDYKIRSGAAESLAPAFPAVLHGDVAGVVEEVGPGVTDFESGDEVYACAGGVRGTSGSLAEYTLADADLLARKPPSLSMREAAALPLVTITAWDGLVERASIEPGDSVLVHGGTGGVGHVAVQLAERRDAVVTATASTAEKRETAHELGADHTVDYCERSVEEYVDEHTDGRGFDVVFDSVGTGSDNLPDSFEAAARKGHVITTVARGSPDLNPLHDKALSFDVVFMLLPLLYGEERARHGEMLSRAATLVENGDLRPLLDETRFDVDEPADAHRRAESGNHVGKVTLACD